MIDFSKCERSIGRKYDGANGQKIGIIYNDAPYMLKFPVPPKEKANGIDYSHYTNSCFSEYISCHIFNELNIHAQETILGTFNDKIVVACKDFVPLNYRLNNFITVKNEIIDSENIGSGTELSGILEAIEKQTDINPQELKERFWDTFIVDAYVGNFDRHNGNWGIVSSLVDRSAFMAPIYDCGSTLYPKVSDTQALAILNNKEDIQKRIFVFPTSAIKENNTKINYYNYLMNTSNEDCLSSIKRIVPRINKNNINDIVNNTPYLSDIKKNFITTMLNHRYELILEPALERAISLEEKKSLNKTVPNLSIAKAKEKGGFER